MTASASEGPRYRPMLIGRLAVMMLLAMHLGACSDPLRLEECEALLDHYLERLVKKRHPSTGAGEMDRLKEEARSLAHRNPSFGFESCPSEISRSQFRCAMDAPTVDAIERCLVF